LKKKIEMLILKLAKDKIYLIIACICPFIWGFYWLYYKNFIIYNRYWDFMIFYFAGMQLLTNPSQLYYNPYFYYLPSFAVFFALYVLIFPYIMAYYISYLANMVFSALFLRELDKILLLLNVKNKKFRFLLLLLAGNSWFLYFTFTFVQTKIFVGLVIIYVLRKEIQINMENTYKSSLYYIIQYSLLIFAVGMAPSLILLLLIIFFHDINFDDFLKRRTIKKFLLMIVIFLIQNFYFIFFPETLLSFFEGINWSSSHKGTRCCFFYQNPLPLLNNNYFTMVSTIMLLIFTIILIFNKTFSIERKIGSFSAFYLFFGVYNCFTLFHILMSFSLLLYIPYFTKNDKLLRYIKNNKILLINLIAVGGINLMPPFETIMKYFPFIMSNIILFYIIVLRYIILFLIYGFTLLLLLIKKEKTL